jgi:hypothetical protein
MQYRLPAGTIPGKSGSRGAVAIAVQPILRIRDTVHIPPIMIVRTFLQYEEMGCDAASFSNCHPGFKPTKTQPKAQMELLRGRFLEHGGGLAVEVILPVAERITFRGMHDAIFMFRWAVDRVQLQGLLS